jgi:hypothetical protein
VSSGSSRTGSSLTISGHDRGDIVGVEANVRDCFGPQASAAIVLVGCCRNTAALPILLDFSI